MKDCEIGGLLLSNTDILSSVDDRNKATKHQLKSQCESKGLLKTLLKRSSALAIRGQSKLKTRHTPKFTVAELQRRWILSLGKGPQSESRP